MPDDKTIPIFRHADRLTPGEPLEVLIVPPTAAELEALLRPPRIAFEPAEKLRQLAAEYQRDGFSRKAAELEIIADGLEALALRGVR